MELSFLAELTIFLQLTISLALGMLLGAERSIAGKAAGMRTYALVAVAATLFIVVATKAAPALSAVGGVDQLRIVAAIIAGVGFLGAGTIIFRKEAVKGLTTAAGFWVAAGLGVAVGYELYAIALFTTALTLFIFTVLWHFEQYLERRTIQPDERTRVIEEEKK